MLEAMTRGSKTFRNGAAGICNTEAVRQRVEIETDLCDDGTMALASAAPEIDRLPRVPVGRAERWIHWRQMMMAPPIRKTEHRHRKLE